VVIPYSIVADVNGQLHDVALAANPILINNRAPGFFMDWKRKTQNDAETKFGWDKPKHKLDVHHQHDREKRKAEEAKLFAYDAVVPHEHEWLCSIDLSRVEQAERTKVAEQLHDVLRQELKDLGKTKASVKADWQEKESIGAKYASDTTLRDGLWIITLQTPALICDVKQLNEASGEAELRAAYEAAWDDLSEGLLRLDYYFAGQHLAGGKYLHMRFQNGKPYNPFFLTDAGSVFILSPTDGNEQRAAAKVEDWLSHGLPLPNWAVERYNRNSTPGSHWTNCPYIPENGYGEIAVNLDVHWLLKPNGGDDEV